MHPRLCLILLAACVRTTPQPPSGPDLANGASGCQELQAGNWVHANEAHYRYWAEDDGGTLTLAVSHVFDAGFSPRRFRVDAGAPRGLQPAADAGSLEPSQQVRIELQRTATGFEGATLAMVTMPSGQQCEARFPTTVIDCRDGGLVLQTQNATVLGDACQPPAKPQDVRIQQHRLVRPSAPL